MKIAAAYIRVSTDNQLELSPDSQIKQIRDYAKRNDMIVPDEFIFRDDGISGRTTSKRPEFNRMIGVAKTKPKPFDVILLWKFSRFARNREDSIVYKSMLRKQCGIEVVSISENLGDDKMSILVEAMIEAMDEYYSINLAEEVKRGMQERFSRGQIVSAPPLGYSVKDGIFVPDENAALINRIFSDFANGKGIRTIAMELNSEGYKTKQNNSFECRTIEYILQNPVYVGKLRKSFDGRGSSKHFNNTEVEIVKGHHEPIISDEMFNQVQEKLKSNKLKYQKYARRTGIKRPFLLQGLVHCSNCDGTLTISRVQNGAAYLQCHRYAHGKCDKSHSISEEKINNAVIAELTGFVKSNSNIDVNIKSKPSETADSTFAIKREKDKLVRVKQAYEAGIDTLEEYRDNKAAILERIDALEAKNKPTSKKEALKLLKGRIRESLKIINDPSINVETKNEILREYIEKIVYSRQSDSISIFYYV